MYPAMPEPAIVVTVPDGSIFLMQLEPQSVMYMFEFESIATPYGLQKQAFVPTPSTETHIAPDPANVDPANVVTSKLAGVD